MRDGGWTQVLDEPGLSTGRLTRVEVEGDVVLLYRRGDDVFAISSRCTHAGMSLDRGPVQSLGADAMVTCPAHGSRFGLRDGRVLRGPALRPLQSYEGRIADGQVEIRSRA
jgi:nitrite reductase/ring-hydroxylating ferredoxin subunit